jgi:hypothetical protein
MKLCARPLRLSSHISIYRKNFNDDPTGEQQFFHIAIAEAEAVVEPRAVADNLRGETVVFM